METSRRCSSGGGSTADRGLVLLDEPFRGVDVGARADIAARLRERAGNIGIVIASSDPAEVVQVADRIVVVAGGDVTGELSVAEVTGHELSGLMAIERAARQVDGSAAGSSRVKGTLAWVAYRYGLLVVLVGLLVFFALSQPHFRTSDNGLIILQSVAIVAIVALGVTVSMVVGGFDLSVGANVSFVVMVTALAMIRYDLSGAAAIVAGLLAGLLVAAVNTALIILARVPDLVATLGTMFIFQGLALIITVGKSVSVGMPIGDGEVAPGSFTDSYRKLGNGKLLSIPVPVLFLFALAVLTHVFLTHTRWGRALYAIGGNSAAARLAGIPVQRYQRWPTWCPV